MNKVKQQPSVWQVIHSVLAAAFGVQKKEAHRRDFEHGNPWIFVAVALVAVALFVWGLMSVVDWVLAATG